MLVGEVGPLEAQAIGKPFGGQRLHCRQRLPGTRTAGRAAEDGNGRVEVVALHAVRRGAVFRAGNRPQRHGFARAIAGAQAQQVSGGATKFRVGLCRDLEAAAEKVEIVDEGRAKIDFERLEDVFHRHTELLCANPVDVEVQLRRTRLEQGENPRQPGCLVGGGHHVNGGRGERIEAAPVSVLQHHAKAAGITNSAHRRRVDYQYRGLIDGRHFRPDLHHQLVEFNAPGLAFLVGCERCKHRRGVGRVGVGHRRETGKGHGPGHAFNRQQFVDGPGQHALGALQFSAGGQLHGNHDVALVQVRDKARGHRPELDAGQDHQRQVDHTDHGAAPHQRRHQPGVAAGHLLKSPVEPGEDALQPAAQARARRSGPGWPEYQCGQGGAQGQRNQRRDEGGRGDGQGKLLEKLAGDAADKRRGYEYRRQHQGNRHHGATDFVHGAVRRLWWGHALMQVALYVFHHHDGVIDDDPYGQHQAEQGQVIQAEPERRHHREGAYQGHRYGQYRDQGSTQVLEEHDNNQYHQCHRFEDGDNDRVDRGLHILGGVVGDLVGEPRRKVLRQFLYGRL